MGYLKHRLSEKRYSHVCSVADECMRYSDLFSLSDSQKADLYTASLLHDITKEEPLQEHISILKRNKITLPEDEMQSPLTLHARTGALLAKEKYGINGDIFSMIDAHTTGKENMSVCEKLLFLCDFIEPKRTNPACRRLRDFFLNNLKAMPAYTALDSALLESMDSTIRYLVDEKRPISQRTIRARNFILQTKGYLLK